MTEEEIQEHISWLQSMITNLKQAITAISTGTQKSYTINDGQTSQSVTKKDLNTLRVELRNYIAELGESRAELNRSGTVYVRGAQ